jgi:predicted permease
LQIEKLDVKNLTVPTYWELLLLIAPIFLIVGIGIALRRFELLTEAADQSLLNLVVKFLYPCLIFENVLGNPALRSPANLLLPPLAGFATMALGIVAAFLCARMLGMKIGKGRRTFAFTTGIYNYGYIPIPLVAALYGRGTLGVLLVFNVGCEAAIWTVGILVLCGLPLSKGWRLLANPPVYALLAAVATNVSGLADRVPAVAINVVHLCAVCAIPLGLILIGATLADIVFEKPSSLLDRVVTPAACALRMALFPFAMLLLARYLPASPELRRVIVMQAAMPAAILPIVIAKHYGGRSETAAQVAVATNLLGLLLIPFWLRIGLAWAGQ